MEKLVILTLIPGSFDIGFSVILRIKEKGKHDVQVIGQLPPAINVLQLFSQWQSAYRQLVKTHSRIEAVQDQVTNFSCYQLGEQLVEELNKWLNSGFNKWQKIREELQRHMTTTEEIIVIIETDEMRLQQLPWHLWDFFSKYYTKAEIALSLPEYKLPVYPERTVNSKVKILAILGNSVGINIQQDQAFLEQLPQAEITFLVEPRRHLLNNHLWEEQWDILFFAGHSSSQSDGNTGRIYINQGDSLSLTELKNGLTRAIERGLQLAIFNSCDGLGLARELADLHIPQVVVMREPVPDVVAQEFLQHFLKTFAEGKSLYLAVRASRERLQGLEAQYPYATWLPVICQNPATVPPTWQELCAPAPSSFDSPPGSASLSSRKKKLAKRRGLGAVLLTSMAAAATVMGVRYMGMLQPLELQAFDHLVRLRPDEKPDSRILLITISENDIRAQNPNLRRGSISDWALNRVLQVLEKNQARAIGLDIYRDFPTRRDDLAKRFKSDRFVAVCKVRDVSSGDPGTPPPPEVPVESQGFSDSLEDSDGVIRRYLFYMTPDPASPCVAPYAFSMQVAFRYLAAQGILPKVSEEEFLQLGNVIFRPLEAHTGGYQGIDAWSHQTLLNYRSPRGPQNVAAQISLMQLLRGQFDPSWVKDRVVLIGTTANSFQDFWHTPYSNNQQSARQLPGVLVQAQMVSQILSAVLDNRPLLWAWPLWAELLWVLGWSLIAGIIAAMRWRSPLQLGVAIIGVTVCLYGLSLILLLEIGCWVPLVPSALALLVTSGSVATYNTTGYLRQLVLKSS